MFEVIIGDRQENYKGGSMNKSITPEGNPEGSAWSVEIKTLESATIKLKKDMEVDVFDTDKCWQRGSVKEILKGNAVVIVEGKELSTKFENIKLCGSRVKTMKCEKSGGGGPRSAKVSFQIPALDKVPEGYMKDDGALADFHGEFKFGWSNENSLNCTSDDAKVKAEPLTSSGCFFVPPKDSVAWEARGLGQEQSNNWHMEVPNGVFRVSVLLGSPTDETYNCISLNGKPFPKTPVTLKKGQTQMVMASEKISTGRVVLSARCDENDPFIKAAITGIVTTEVSPVGGGKADDDSNPVKLQLSKKSFEGGDCLDNAKNCLFWPHESTKAKCDGD